MRSQRWLRASSAEISRHYSFSAALFHAWLRLARERATVGDAPVGGDIPRPGEQQRALASGQADGPVDRCPLKYAYGWASGASKQQISGYNRTHERHETEENRYSKGGAAAFQASGSRTRSPRDRS